MPILSHIRQRGFATWIVIALVAFGLAAALVSADWYTAEPRDALLKAEYVGRESCTECHQAEHQDFLGSHHDRAMELATEESVIGDFADTTFERLGVTTKFFRRDAEYWVNTEGPDGEYHDYQIKYTFGIDPLQQYMVEFPDGRVQVLRVSWDTHNEEWFYVPPPDAPDERLPPDDPTHWTGLAQNWNTMCADCHSTNLQKNYDLDSDSYTTTFSEIDVSCEACHGPGSLHIKLAKSRSLFWDRNHGFGLAKLKSKDSTPQIEACAKCHSRRSEVHPDFRPARPFGDFYNPSLLREGLYHADGQIMDEVYVHGSFLQSRMYREGVRCSDCHDPHSLQLKFKGNALCGQCHIPAKYDTPTHHHHKVDTPGASCVECHMPETKYMVVDPRRDHSIRVPRPDLTVAIGTPNACNNCHTKPYESAEWAAEKVVEWYGDKRPNDPHWSTAIAGGREADPSVQTEIIEAITRQTTPAIVKATLIELLAQYSAVEARLTVEDALNAPDSLVRQAAAANVSPRSPEHLVGLLSPLLSDPIRTVRIAAVVRLLGVPDTAFRNGPPEEFKLALDEYKQQLTMTSDRGGSHVMLSQLARREGDTATAAEEIRTAIRLQPYLTGPRAELAILLASTAGDQKEIDRLRREEIALMKRDVTLVPGSGDIRYRLGLLHYFVDELDNAERRVAEARELEPRNYQFELMLALLQQERYKRGEEQALKRAVDTLRRLNKLEPDRPEAESILRELYMLRQQRQAAVQREGGAAKSEPELSPDTERSAAEPSE